MIKKAIIIGALMFIIQLIVSCRCNCPEPEYYDVSYTGIVFSPFNTLLQEISSEEDSLTKESFGLNVLFDIEEKLISWSAKKQAFKFNSLMACSCLDKDLSYPDPISHVEIFVVDRLTNQKKKATSYFRTKKYYSDDWINITDFFEEREEWEVEFTFTLFDHDSIPNSAVFIAEAFLESGTMFTSQTNNIDFFD